MGHLVVHEYVIFSQKKALVRWLPAFADTTSARQIRELGSVPPRRHQ
jgi:hypothetical protein